MCVVLSPQVCGKIFIVATGNWYNNEIRPLDEESASKVLWPLPIAYSKMWDEID